jgi:hypothetical protein
MNQRCREAFPHSFSCPHLKSQRLHSLINFSSTNELSQEKSSGWLRGFGKEKAEKIRSSIPHQFHELPVLRGRSVRIRSRMEISWANLHRNSWLAYCS